MIIISFPVAQGTKLFPELFNIFINHKTTKRQRVINITKL